MLTILFFAEERLLIPMIADTLRELLRHFKNISDAAKVFVFARKSDVRDFIQVTQLRRDPPPDLDGFHFAIEGTVQFLFDFLGDADAVHFGDRSLAARELN